MSFPMAPPVNSELADVQRRKNEVSQRLDSARRNEGFYSADQVSQWEAEYSHWTGEENRILQEMQAQQMARLRVADPTYNWGQERTEEDAKRVQKAQARLDKATDNAALAIREAVEEVRLASAELDRANAEHGQPQRMPAWSFASASLSRVVKEVLQ